ncbi:hypothetical protein CEY16_06645 [Halalkalibacillus sediminis]|uniref:Intracellular proteinase inhibitor BsuPI domain-containing protein n=1 Tax=Halalkalibacillus sediminis TaxID=2018042 RepID=A0A2I0QTE4_9BACI|nr:hypothetical protein [Halalkalibacillus sediminis]PKR77611.1 hypothetical protein CEY16_06645 [Halalkalibacillus sediminis]
MRRLVLILSIFFMLAFGLFACGTDNSGQSNSNERPNDTEDTKQEGDFEVSINVENENENPEVHATITYIGEKEQKNIYHGGSIFFFNIYQVNGDFEHIGGMNEPLLTTTLKKDEVHKVEFDHPSLDELETGEYEFEAIADFSLDKDNYIDNKREITVSKIVNIK